MLASATGAVAPPCGCGGRTKKPDPSMINGMLAGLVRSRLRALSSVLAASLLGLIAGILVVESVFFFDKMKIDDAVGPYRPWR